MVIEILLIWLAFILVYFQEHLKNIYHTLLPNPFSWRRWWAVMKGTFTKKTAFPFIIIVLLTVALIFVNNWQISSMYEAENKNNAALINAVNQSLDDRNKDLTDRLDKVIELLEAQNATGSAKRGSNE